MLDGAHELYQWTILERGRNPRHATRLPTFDGSARGHNALCGDRCHVFVRRDARARIAAIGFEARGCAISIAAADLMADAVVGLDAPATHALCRDVAALAETGAGAVPEPLRPLAGLHAYKSRIKCAMLPWHALLAALDGQEEGIDG